MIVIKSMIFVVLYSFIAMIIGLFFMGVSRKVTARLHRRYGPPVWQAYIDVIKAFSRKSVSYNYVMDLGAMMGLAGLLAAAMFIPYAGIKAGSIMQPFASDGPLILILYLMPIGYLGLAMCVAASGNPLATIGIGRALTLMLGYEVPFVIIVLSMIARYDTTSLVEIMKVQGDGVLSWNVFRMPVGFVATLIAMQAMLAKKPFDTMIAPSEIASGPMVELSGKFLGLGFLQFSAAIFVETSLLVILFLGGGKTMFDFFLKQMLVYIFMTMVSDIWGRFKVEQAVRFLWVAAGGLALVQLIISVVWN
jgi:NADH-quinone oxidoreductase subunit H